jgi:PAS domain S-box-containing protein
MTEATGACRHIADREFVGRRRNVASVCDHRHAEVHVVELAPQVVAQMVGAAADGVVIVDREGVINYWNQGAERIFGHLASKMIGSSLDVIIPERLRQRHGDGFRAAMARGTSKYGKDDLLAVPAIAAGGETISIESIVVLMAGSDGQVDHVGAIIRDVTARRAREKEMLRRLEALEAIRLLD